jgi:hypothetical protein
MTFDDNLYKTKPIPLSDDPGTVKFVSNRRIHKRTNYECNQSRVNKKRLTKANEFG